MRCRLCIPCVRRPREVRDNAVITVRPERTGFAAFVPVGVIHEVIDEKLRLIAKQLAKALLAIFARECVIRFDSPRRQGAPLFSDLVVLLL